MTVINPPIKVRPDVLAVPAYKQGKAPANLGFKLSSNENPFGPLPVVQAAVANRTDYNRYIAADVTKLREAIAAAIDSEIADHGSPATTNTIVATEVTTSLTAAHIHIGAGSVAILYQLIGAVAGTGDNYIHAWPSFEAYPLLGTVSAAVPKAVPLTTGARHDLDAMAAAVDENTRAVLLCSPNNPTGPTITAAEFANFMANVPKDILVVLDEAYAEFVTDKNAVSGAALLNTYSNLVVLRTFAKAQGLAGLRIGYGIAHPAIWDAVRPVAIPMSINAMAEAAALAALTPTGREQLAERIDVLVSNRAELVAGLQKLGLEIPAAQGNFVWLSTASLSAARAAGAETAHAVGDGASADPHADIALAYADHLAAAGILVRPFAGHGVRISVAEAESIPAVLAATHSFLEQTATATERAHSTDTATAEESA